jgi:hypothetical protein
MLSDPTGRPLQSTKEPDGHAIDMYAGRKPRLVDPVHVWQDGAVCAAAIVAHVYPEQQMPMGIAVFAILPVGATLLEGVNYDRTPQISKAKGPGITWHWAALCPWQR